MYAVVRTGNKQFRVETGARIRVEKLDGEIGSEIALNDVLMLNNNGETRIGQPTLNGASVRAKIVAQDRSPKVIAFKKRRRKGFHKTIGHRQSYTELQIINIAG